ncbi:MAG: methyltransferase [Dysgonamonadaceae bacterium]|nr:methyltransferase [Dysgonamonadaceae bacterium]
MSQPYFQFKQFTVRHDLCAMKVGTDGALLGAWADCSRSQCVLDVGTGSGLIALMLAQRSYASIDAVDIDLDACRQAEINFANSPFADRMRIFNADFRNFEPNKKYDLIVSNPPFFTDSLKSPVIARSIARHDDSLPMETLISKSASLLNPSGRLALIIPANKLKAILQSEHCNLMHLCRKTYVYPLFSKPYKRILLELSLSSCDYQEDDLLIETSPGHFSDGFTRLLKDFYLHL